MQGNETFPTEMWANSLLVIYFVDEGRLLCKKIKEKNSQRNRAIFENQSMGDFSLPEIVTKIRNQTWS
jgi:hypothetical protein